MKLFFLSIFITPMVISQLFLITAAHFSDSSSSCGAQKCPPIKPGMINVHVICHSHLDTGWVRTFEEYYRQSVREILNSVVYHLPRGNDRRFIMVETSFFSRWWRDQEESVQNLVRGLVESGQLEFISGGWSMNDEACPRYQTVIDQLTLGHKWLNDTFGPCALPKIGWQIDPFGHSREYASILAQMGFDALFLGRIDYQDKLARQRNRSLEFVWKASPSLGKSADLFTGVLPNVYWPPDGFCWDSLCSTETIHDGNVMAKAKHFITMMRHQAESYATNNTVVTLGMDFHWQDAARWFENLDPLIKAVNSLQQTEHVNMFYSTPSCYLRSLQWANRAWPVKMDDFLPYADSHNSYWTGFYTTRPSLKYNIRYSNNFLQAAKRLEILASSGNMERFNDASNYRPLQEALGITMHHDAVTGTCKQYVNDDYTRMLSEGIQKAEQTIVNALDRLLHSIGSSSYMTPSYDSPNSSDMYFCHHINMSECEITQTMGDYDSVIVHIFNPIASPVKSYVRLPVFDSHFSVLNSESMVAVSQVVQLSPAIQNLPRRKHNSSLELIFRAQLPPLGYSSYIIRRQNELTSFAPTSREADHSNSPSSSDVTIGNSKFAVVVDASTGLMKEVILSRNRRVPLKQNFHIYRGETSYGERASGAYAFNPTSEGSSPATDRVTYKVIKGPLVEEIHQTFNSWISCVIRVYQHVDYIEFDWVVGPIPWDRWRVDSGQEIVSRFETDLRSNGTFFTDANGRETLRRVRDHRFTWRVESTENVASNYYPVTSWMFIRDYEKNLQLTILPDRTEGGSSLHDGEIEMMVHRRLMRDDGFGVDEPLNEPGEDNRGLIVRGKHYVIVDDIRTSVQKMRILTKSLANKPIMAFRPQGTRAEEVLSRERSEFIGLDRKLPLNINLLSLERWDDHRALIRLEHIFEVNEDPKYSRPRRVSLRDLFSPMRVTSAEEVTLNGQVGKTLATAQQMQWQVEFDPYFNYTNQLTQIDSTETNDFRESTDNLVLFLYPMEIKTYLITFERS